jgi:hypothetical protein
VTWAPLHLRLLACVSMCAPPQLIAAEVQLLQAGLLPTQVDAHRKEISLLQQRCERLEAELAATNRKKHAMQQELHVRGRAACPLPLPPHPHVSLGVGARVSPHVSACGLPMDAFAVRAFCVLRLVVGVVRAGAYLQWTHVLTPFLHPRTHSAPHRTSPGDS